MLLVKQWHMQKLTKSLKAKERKINKNDYISMCLCVYMHYTGTCIETKMILSSMQEVPRTCMNNTYQARIQLEALKLAASLCKFPLL